MSQGKAAKVAAEVSPDVLTGGIVAEAGPRPDFSLWTAEDDLLLKNAMEAGAAMEALAKGAMRFSRRYTVKELRERWRALLYDPEIAAAAAARMVEAEAAFMDSMRLMFPSKQKVDEFVEKRREKSVRATYYKNKKGIIDEDKQGQDGSNAMTMKEDTEDRAFFQMVSLLAAGGVGAVLGDMQDNVEDFGADDATVAPSTVTASDTVIAATATAIADTAATATAVTAATTDTATVIAAGAATVTDAAAAVVTNAATDSAAAAAATATVTATVTVTDAATVPTDVHEDIADGVDEEEGYYFGLSDDGEDVDEEIEHVSKKPRVPEPFKCALNLQDTQIPALDDSLLPRSPTHWRSPEEARTDMQLRVYGTATATAASEDRVQLSQIEAVLQDDEDECNILRPYSSGLDIIPGDCNVGGGDDDCVGDEMDVENDDEDIASFSDVEAMILDMDLDPGDDDVSARAESKRMYRKQRGRLMRLEQCVRFSMQRRLTMKGAMAIFYGHHLKYFITKDEVSIGRMTQENIVDIDLGQEGRANKVSRRQASIKLKEDGVFYLKNIGRKILYVNSIVVESGQRAGLSSNCLIEVGGMRFIFEINNKLLELRIKQMHDQIK